MKSYVLIKVRTGEIKEVVKQLRKMPSVRSAEMTFGPYDVIAVVEHADLNKLGLLIAAEMVAEIGRLLGGWTKSSVTSGSSDPL
ncbi:MAG: hypothetical protein OHK0031_10220 [Anaerolineales bacterium]